MGELISPPVAFTDRSIMVVPSLQSETDIRDQFDQAIRTASEFAEQFLLTSDNRKLLTVGTALAHVIRPDLRTPWQPDLSGWSMLHSRGGPENNTYKEIDYVGPEIFRRVFGNKLSNTAVYVEENERWTASDLENNPPPNPGRLIIWDPVDGSSCIGKYNMFGEERSNIASGMVVLDKDQQLEFGFIISLVDDRMMVFDGEKMRYIKYQEPAGFNPWSYQEISPPVTSANRSESAIRFATLERRLPILKTSGLLKSLNIPVDPDHFYPSMGGEALLTLAMGNKAGYPAGESLLDVMMDPVKGQGPHEALIWLNMAKAAGLTVTSPQGFSIDLKNEAKNFCCQGFEEDRDRIPYIIGKDPAVNSLIVSSLSAGKPD
ncbi:hypothetical protein A3E42_02995 [Candidatus Gottesmanbacteria bacterium RIFCSPHIGHO2_12_FULL_40_13]|nr:MAG: hypothetical protein A3E42_02995 [Candidatus Gottesmanbacteria bacterium RIFCSPHIGHO2_12_FULL_40_13]